MNQSLDVYGGEVQADTAHERAVSALLVAFKGQVQEWKDTLLRGKDRARLDQHWGAFQKQEQKVDDLTRRLLATLPDGEGKALVEKFAAAHVVMGEGYRKGFDTFKAAGFDSTVGDRAVAGVDREPSKLLGLAGDRIEADAAEASAAAALNASRTIHTSLAGMAVVCAIGIFGGFMFSRTITRPLGRAVDTTRAVAGGDLSLHIDAAGKDEIAELLQSLVHMQASLSRVVIDVRENSDSVATASAEIAAGNLDLSARTEQQASALQQTAASMEELGSTVRQTADNAQQANQLAAGASSVAASGGVTIDRVIETMKGIN